MKAAPERCANRVRPAPKGVVPRQTASIVLAGTQDEGEGSPQRGQPRKGSFPTRTSHEVAPRKGAIKEGPTPEGFSPLFANHKQVPEDQKSWATMVEEEEFSNTSTENQKRQEDVLEPAEKKSS